MVATSRGASQITSGENHMAVLPKNYVPNGTIPGILFCHGYGAADTVVLDRGGWPNLTAAMTIIGEHWPVLSCSYGGDTFGNDTALSRIALAKSYLQNTFGAKSGAVGIIGVSMGGGLAYCYKRGTPSAVSCLLQLLPLSDLNDVWANNRGGVGTAGVNAAYGGSYNDSSYGPTHNPTVFADQLSGTPTQIWYATDDTTVIPSTVTTVASAIGNTAELHTLTGGHTDTALAGLNVDQILSFLSAHL